MQIKISRPDNNLTNYNRENNKQTSRQTSKQASRQTSRQTSKQNSKQNSRENNIRMTLQQYLESTNLKRKIQQRSRSKQMKRKSNNCDINGQVHHLQPPTNQTNQYFKLNQEWKSRKVFASWITMLKQLCRQYIKQDNLYVQVIRLIQKLAQFVKSQIQTIKKDNLLLQSYLITDASYWPAQGSAYTQENVSNNDKVSNYLKTLLGTSQFYVSPCKSQEITQNQVNTKNKIPKSNERIQNNYQTASEPKKIKFQELNSQQQHNSITKPNSQQLSSTCMKQKNVQSSNPPSSSMNHRYPNKDNPHLIYSFNNNNHFNQSSNQQQQKFTQKNKDQYINAGNSKKTQKYQQQTLIDNRNNKQINQDIIIVEPFDEDHDNLLGSSDQRERYCQMGLLRICSNANEEQVPRLSLMSRYDQNKTSQQNRNENAIDKKQIQKNSTFSQISTVEQHPRQKIPFRQRRQSVKKVNEQIQHFEFIVLDQNNNINQKHTQIRSYELETKINGSVQKIGIQQYTQNSKGRRVSDIHPTPLRNSPHIISLETPSTLRRRSDKQQSSSRSKQILEHKAAEKVVVSHQTIRAYEYGRPSRSFTYVPPPASKPPSSVNRNRQNIMQRYQNFRKTD